MEKRITSLRSFVPTRLFVNLLTHLRTPLYRNGYALILSVATTSGLGLVYWALAARYYTPAAIGVNGAAIAAMQFVSGVTQFNLTSALVRFVPGAGRATRRLVGYTYAITLLATLVIVVVVRAGLGWWSPVQRVLGTSPVYLVWFTLACMTWSIFTFQDSVLTGLRQAVWVPIENTVFALVKIGLLIAFAGSFGGYGIWASWTIPVALSLLPVNLLIFRRLMPRHSAAADVETTPILPKEIATYVAGNYAGTIFALAATSLLPLLVNELRGTSAGGHFYQVWIIANSLQAVALNMGASLTVEVARDQRQLRTYTRRVLLHTGRLLIPVVGVVILGAPLILRILGKSYATEGAGLLRLLALAALPNIVNIVFIGVARVQRQIKGIVAVQAALCGGSLGLSYLLLPRYGITGVGWAWLLSQSVVAVVLLLTQLRPLLQKDYA